MILMFSLLPVAAYDVRSSANCHEIVVPPAGKMKRVLTRIEQYGGPASNQYLTCGSAARQTPAWQAVREARGATTHRGLDSMIIIYCGDSAEAELRFRSNNRRTIFHRSAQHRDYR